MPLLLLLFFADKIWAQPCSGAPSFTIDLSGSPDSTWTSSSIARSGDCCGSSNPDRCIEFNLTLDSLSSGIKLDIPSGALPGGALFYQIGCGVSYQVGVEICLSGPGPHRITFCKPGNNTNVYQIKAIPKPDIRGKLLITQACIGFLQTTGLVDTSISWESVPNNPTYNSYLSCLHGCDSVSIIPTGSYPPTVTYRVCGLVQGGCVGTTFCDTATVHFVTDIDVDIQPKNATVCFGGTNTTLTANAIGGLAPFHYTWSTGATTSSISVGAGTYHVSMTDSLGCFVVRDTVIVTSFTLPIDANAGNDTTVCTRANNVLLNGIVQAAGGGR
ncbi:MAG: SprB repeat-containing protein, partial [Bacteroidota bacterium]